MAALAPAPPTSTINPAPTIHATRTAAGADRSYHFGLALWQLLLLFVAVAITTCWLIMLAFVLAAVACLAATALLPLHVR
jgi:hypothetical protein